MLVDFGAAWWGLQGTLEHLTFSDARVIELAREFVAVRVDATKRTPEVDALMRQYSIRGLPWVAFVQPDGTVLHDLTVTGFVNADDMLARMRRALPRVAAAS
jgi:thiol:disulfide interchange protein